MFVSGNSYANYDIDYSKSRKNENDKQKQFLDFEKKASELQGSTTVVIGGEEMTLKRNWMPRFTYEDLVKGNDVSSKYNYTQGRGLNKEENSISIVPGMTIDLKNGMTLEIKDNGVDIKYDKNSYSDKKFQDACEKSTALNRFIRYANGQSGSFGYSEKQRAVTEDVLNILGINTNRQFSVNGTEFTKKEGSTGAIEKVGVTNLMYTWVPTKQMREIFDRYEMNFKWL